MRSVFMLSLVGLSSVALLSACEVSTPPSPQTASSSNALESEGSEWPLGAALEVVISADGSSATLHVTNTTPDSSSTVPGAPILTRFGFNVLDGPDASCLSLDAGGLDWHLTDKVNPFCGIGGAGDESKGKGKGGASGQNAFMYSLEANNPKPANGLGVGETGHFTLTVKPGCDFTFTQQSFAMAPLSPSGGELVPWAAKLQVVGENGEDSGCATGDIDMCVPPEYTLSEFIATTAMLTGLPLNNAGPPVTAAGSVEVNTWGSVPDPTAAVVEPAFEAARVNLRNGAGATLELWELNRNPAKAPGALDANGCEPGAPFLHCWYWAPDALDASGMLTAILPHFATSSNDGFDVDPPVERVEISGGITMDYSGGATFTDNSHQTAHVIVHAPLGLDTAAILWRVRLDTNLNGLGADDPFITLFSHQWGGDYVAPPVEVIIISDTELALKVNVQAALELAGGDPDCVE